MLNQCQFIGNLGRDPEVKSTQRGDKVANLSIGCSERWKDRDGQRQERTTWVPVVIWGPLVDVAERYLRKGSKVFVQGKFSVRKWKDQSGNDRYTTEIVLQGYDARLELLDGRREDTGPREQRDERPSSGGGSGWDDAGGFDDDSGVPF